MSLSLDDLLAPISRYLDSDSTQKELLADLNRLYRRVALGEDNVVGLTTHAASSALALLRLLFRAPGKSHPERARSYLERLAKSLRRGGGHGLRRQLPKIFRELGPLWLCAVESPLEESSFFYPETPRCEWVDVGLVELPMEGSCEHPSDLQDHVTLIPFSVFTRRFFQEDLPFLVREPQGTHPTGTDDWQRPHRDGFTYHPENDQALLLLERHPQLRAQGMTFQYFVDDAGLAEIIIDRDEILAAELELATKLFCLRNKVRKATLDGRRVVDSPEAF